MIFHAVVLITLVSCNTTEKKTTCIKGKFTYGTCIDPNTLKN